jgi:hypothetical protein
MVAHIQGPKNVDHPGVWLFPEILVYLDWGIARFAIREAKLAMLTAGTRAKD